MTFAGFFGFIAMMLMGGEAEQAARKTPPPVRMMTIQQEMILGKFRSRMGFGRFPIRTEEERLPRLRRKRFRSGRQ